MFQWTPHNMKIFLSLSSSHLLKVTKFSVEILQFKFLVMTENVFCYWIFQILVYFLCKNCSPFPPLYIILLYYYIHIILIKHALQIITIQALWQLVHLGTPIYGWLVGLLESESSFLLEPALCFVWEKVEINFSDKKIMSVIPIITLVFKRKFLLTDA